MRAEVSVSSDAVDTDVTMKLPDVFRDGRAVNIVEGITRSRHRDSSGKPEMMKPGAVYTVPMDLAATSWYLPAGHRLRVEVSSSNFHRFLTHGSKHELSPASRATKRNGLPLHFHVQGANWRRSSCCNAEPAGSVTSTGSLAHQPQCV